MKTSKVIKIMLLFLILYVVQFLIFPQLFEHYYPDTNETTIIYFLTLTIAIISGMTFISDKMLYWMVGNLFYFILIFIYSAKGAYGIGLRGMTLAGSQATYDRDVQLVFVTIYAICALILEIAIKILKKISKKYKCIWNQKYRKC